MKYIKVFTQDTDYQTFMGGGVNLPNVSYCRKENEMHYNPIVEYTIEYTSSDGNIVEPYSGSTKPFIDINGNNILIVSNTYKNGKGIIKLEKECYQIGDRAFQSCTSLSSITIPDSVTFIGRNAFFYCTSLTGITIPDSVTFIGLQAFSSWTGATSTDNIIFPNEQLKIKYFENDYAFSSWKSLTSVTIPNGVTSIRKQAFYSCTSLTGITIPDKVTSIGDSAFYDCTSLAEITLGNSVTLIGNWAFQQCTSLTSITIPNSVISIGASAFRWCSSLTGITIHDKVTSIDGYAFYGCRKLSSITVLPEKPPTLDSSAFDDIASDAVIYVPSGSVEAYKSATNWSTYADKIQPIQK